ncbi:MAG: cytochrome c-type biogenesis protein CcmH [Bryobacteraceae bacterium]
MTRRRWALGLVASFGALAQMRTQSDQDIYPVASRLACQCGCADTVASCKMPGCHFAEPARQKIREMKLAGMADQQIIDDFVKKHGPGILRGEPSSLGWIIPYVALSLGLGGIYLFVKRYYRKPEPLAEIPAGDARYHEQIEKELKNLD